MKLPHWLRHHWTEWESGGFEKGNMIAAYDWRNYDVRSCRRCGRRQMRHI